MRLQIEVRTAAREPVGLIEKRDACTLVLRHNGVGTWTVRVPLAYLDVELLEALQEGGGVTITDLDLPPDAAPVTSGDVDEPEEGWGVRDPYDGSVTFSGRDDARVLDDRITYPVPGSAWATQGASEYDARSGAAETVIKGYVNANAGPGALVARRHPGLTLAPDLARGSTVTEQTRFEDLLELCQRLATAGGLGFAIIQVGTGLVFDVNVPVLRDGILLAPEAGTVRGITSSRSAPTMTRALVAAKGEGVARITQEVSTAASVAAEGLYVRRVERLVDRRDTDETDIITQAGEEALVDGAATGTLGVTAQDTEAVRYGRDYALGDLVPWSWRGVELVDVVREVKITERQGGALVQPVLGPPSATGAQSDMYYRLRILERMVRDLQRNQ